MRFSLCASNSLVLAVTVGPANAATMYTVTYTATTGLAPVNGSFTYDSDTDSIASFSLLWPIILGVLFFTWGRWNIAEKDLIRLDFVDPGIGAEFYPDSAGTFTITAVEAPEPSTLALVFSALAALHFAPSRLRRAKLFRSAVRPAMRASALK